MGEREFFDDYVLLLFLVPGPHAYCLSQIDKIKGHSIAKFNCAYNICGLLIFVRKRAIQPVTWYEAPSIYKVLNYNEANVLEFIETIGYVSSFLNYVMGNVTLK